MDMQFAINYIIIPIIVGGGILNGKMRENYFRLGQMLCFKGVLYAYYAIVNIVNYCRENWGFRYLAGLTIALAIMECLSGVADGIIELRKHYTDNSK